MLVNKLSLALLVPNRLTKAKIPVQLDFFHNSHFMRLLHFTGPLLLLQLWCIFLKSWSASFPTKHANQLSFRQLATHFSYQIQQFLTEKVIRTVINCSKEFLSVWPNLAWIARFDHQTNFGPLLTIDAHSFDEVFSLDFVPNTIVEIWTFAISLFLQLVIGVIWRLTLVIWLFVFLRFISFN